MRYLTKRRKINIFLLFFAYCLLNGDEYMKQIIPFVKDLNFNTKMSEITSIALEHNLQMENSDSVVGNFTVSGKYKISDISVNEETFEKEIPFDITLDDKYDASKVHIDIDDFYYEIINDEYLRVHIDVLVDNLIYFKKEEKNEEERTDDTNKAITLYNENKEEKAMIDEIQRPILTSLSDENEETTDEIKNEKKQEIREVRKEEKSEENLESSEEDGSHKIPGINTSFLSENERFSTYKVHIIREDETIETIKEKYNVTTDELEKYNSLDKIMLGSKIIVPILDE